VQQGLSHLKKVHSVTATETSRVILLLSLLYGSFDIKTPCARRATDGVGPFRVAKRVYNNRHSYHVVQLHLFLITLGPTPHTPVMAARLREHRAAIDVDGLSSDVRALHCEEVRCSNPSADSQQRDLHPPHLRQPLQACPHA
jgi:hypothetical protein